MASSKMTEFNELFAPFDENYASEIAEKMQTQTGTSNDQYLMPQGLDPLELEKLNN